MGRVRAKPAAAAVPAAGAKAWRAAAGRKAAVVTRTKGRALDRPRTRGDFKGDTGPGNVGGEARMDLDDSSPSTELQPSSPETANDPKTTAPRTPARRQSKHAAPSPPSTSGRRHQTRQRTRLQTKLSALRNRGTQLMDLPPEIRLLILQSLLSTSELLSLRKGTYVEPKQPSDFPKNTSWHDLYCPDFSSSEVEAYVAILSLADGGHARSGHMSSVYALDSRFATARGKARTLIEEAGEIFWRNRFWVGLEGARGLELRGGLARNEGTGRVRRIGCEIKYFSHEEGDNSASGVLNWLLDDKYTALKCVDVCIKGTCAGGYCRPSSAFLSQVTKAVRGLAAKRGTASLTWEYPYEGVMNGSYTVTRPRPWVSSILPAGPDDLLISETDNYDPKHTVPVEDLVLGSSFSTSPAAGREELEHRYDGRKCFRGFHGPWGWLSWKRRDDAKLWRTLRIGCACGTVFWEDERFEEMPLSKKKERAAVKSELLDES